MKITKNNMDTVKNFYSWVTFDVNDIISTKAYPLSRYVVCHYGLLYIVNSQGSILDELEIISSDEADDTKEFSECCLCNENWTIEL